MTVIRHQMSSDEYRELKRNFRLNSVTRRWLIEALFTAMEEAEKREDEAWRHLHERFGTSYDTHDIEIRWHAMEIVVTPKEEREQQS